MTCWAYGDGVRVSAVFRWLASSRAGRRSLVRRARPSRPAKGPGHPGRCRRKRDGRAVPGRREPGPELEPAARPAMIPFGLVLTRGPPWFRAWVLPSRGLSGGTGLPAVPRPRCVTANARPGSLISLQPARQPDPASWTPSSHTSRTWSGSRVPTISPRSSRRRWHGRPWLLSRRLARSRSACTPTRHATRARPGAAAWWTACPPTSSRTSVGGGITLAVQLCDQPLPVPQPQSEHAARHRHRSPRRPQGPEPPEPYVGDHQQCRRRPSPGQPRA